MGIAKMTAIQQVSQTLPLFVQTGSPDLNLLVKPEIVMSDK